MTLVAPWTAASLGSSGTGCLLRWTQSADVIFVSASGYQQRRIERHATRSWSLVNYLAEDGPFRIVNTTATTIVPSATNGDITLTASKSIFKSTHVGGLFRLTSIGQVENAVVGGAGQWSSAIKVSGVGTSRAFTITITGTWVGTITLQRSVGDTANWTADQTYTTNTTTTRNDGLDNQIIYYRIGFDTGNYTSGSATVKLEYSSGGQTGVVLITTYSSGTSVGGAVLVDLGGTTATDDWSEGIWSDFRGWPNATLLYEGRLWWVGKNWVVGSVSDAYESFDDQVEGDSAPIIRTIGSGPVDTISWVLGLQRMILGAQSSEISVRSNTFDEPLTATNFNMKDASTQGSANVDAIKVDTFGLFVQLAGSRIYELLYDVQKYDYGSRELTILCPEIGSPGIIGLAVQRQPDPRVHAWKSDGTVAMALFNPAEDLRCLIDITAAPTVAGASSIEDIFVLPRTEEDAVYYVVKRTINGGTKRFLEKWSKLSECVGGTQNKQSDAFVSGTQAASSTITGLSHLEGETVVVWANGKSLSAASGALLTFTVTSGQITGLTHLGSTILVTSYVVGLSYTAQFKSSKLAYAAALGTALTQRKQLDKMGLILVNTHFQGLQFGPDFSHLANLPLVEAGVVTPQDTIWANYDFDAIPFPADNSNSDARLCLQAQSPRPCMVSAAILGIATDDESP